MRGIKQICNKSLEEVTADDLVLSSTGKVANIISYQKPSCSQETNNLRLAARNRQIKTTTWRATNQRGRDREIFFQAKSVADADMHFAKKEESKMLSQNAARRSGSIHYENSLVVTQAQEHMYKRNQYRAER